MGNLGGAAIIAASEGLIVKAIKRKLTESGVEVAFTGIDAEAVKAAEPNVKLFVIYLPDKVGDMEPVIADLSALIKKTGKGVIVIGDRTGRSELMQKAPELEVSAWCDKSLDMDTFIFSSMKLLGEYDTEVQKRLSRKKVLVIDDDPSFARIVREWLKDIYNVSMVTSGAQAMTFLEKNPVDLVLLDYEMPEVSGPEVFQMMKDTPSTADIPVVFLTGKGDKDSVVHVMSMKPRGYILKSTPSDQIIRLLEDFIGK